MLSTSGRALDSLTYVRAEAKDKPLAHHIHRFLTSCMDPISTPVQPTFKHILNGGALQFPSLRV